MAHRKAPPGTYKVRDHFGTYRTIEIDNLLVAARHAALGRFVEQPTLSTPGDTTRYLEAALGHLEHERFCAIWLDNRHRIGTRRYPRPRSHRDRTDLRVIRGARASLARFGGVGACAGVALFTQQRALGD